MTSLLKRYTLAETLRVDFVNKTQEQKKTITNEFRVVGRLRRGRVQKHPQGQRAVPTLGTRGSEKRKMISSQYSTHTECHQCVKTAHFSSELY
jgi:hypothetical protein